MCMHMAVGARHGTPMEVEANKGSRGLGCAYAGLQVGTHGGARQWQGLGSDVGLWAGVRGLAVNVHLYVLQRLAMGVHMAMEVSDSRHAESKCMSCWEALGFQN